MNRLVRWEPFRIRLDSGAVTALIRERVPAAAVTFNDGFIEASSGPIHARVIVEAMPPSEVRLAIFVNGDAPAIDVKVSLASVLPPFVDVSIAGVEITREGLFIALGPGGADPP